MAARPSVAIVGAGVAGVSCATRLHARGFAVQLFDKSRGVGGRLATRRWPTGLVFDHGAPCFDVVGAEFAAALQRAGDIVQPWPAGATNGTRNDCLIGVPHMNTWLKAAMGSITPVLNTPISSLARTAAGWTIGAQERPAIATADLVLLATPAPQAAALASGDRSLAAPLLDVEYAPCWALMVALGRHAPVNRDVFGDFPSASPLRWLARNRSKPGRSEDDTGWVAHASDRWSAEYLEISPDAALSALLPTVADTLGITRSDVINAQAHRWRYARVRTAAGRDFLQNDAGTLFAVGDGCIGGGVEAAFQSGAALADHLTSAYA